MPPRRKRANAEGSLFYRADRKRWEARITVGRKEDGTPIRRTVVGRTRAEAFERLDNLRRSTAARSDLPAEMTTRRFMEHWISDVLPLAAIAQTTADGYARIAKLYVIPYVGRKRLDQLSPADVRSMLASLRGAGLAPNTQRQARSVLRRALRTALADGLVTRNVAELVDGVRVGRQEGRTLTPQQARTLLTSAREYPYEALVAVLLSTGVRKGEALGLSWADLNLDATPLTLSVQRSLKKDLRGAVYVSEPKTTGSRRTIHLPGSLVDVLRRHRVAQAAQRLEFGAGWGGHWAPLDLVYTSSIGTPLDPDKVNKDVQAITQEAGLGTWTPHELRHSAASILLATGTPLKVVSEMLGHSSIRVTADVYGHLLAPARTEAAEAMESALWG